VALIFLSRGASWGHEVALLGIALAGACHPPGGNDPARGGPPPPPAASRLPSPALRTAVVPGSAAPAPWPPPALQGSTCSQLEALGARWASSLLAGGSAGAAITAADGSRSDWAAGQCLAGQRLERHVTVHPGACTFLEVAGLPPLERLAVEVVASPGAGVPTATYAVDRPEGPARFPEAGCLVVDPERPVVLRFTVTAVAGGGVVAMRVHSAPTR